MRLAPINRIPCHQLAKWARILRELCKLGLQPLIRIRNNNKRVFLAFKLNRCHQTSLQRKILEEVLPLVSIQSFTIKEIVRSKSIGRRWAAKSTWHMRRPRTTTTSSRSRLRRTYSWGIRLTRTYRGSSTAQIKAFRCYIITLNWSIRYSIGRRISRYNNSLRNNSSRERRCLILQQSPITDPFLLSRKLHSNNRGL